MTKKSLRAVGLIAVMFLLSNAAPVFGDDSTERSFFAADLADKANQEGARVFSTGDDSGIGFSQLGRWPDMICKSTKDPACRFPLQGEPAKAYPFGAQIMLGICERETDENCIESVETSRGNDSWTKLRFLRYQATTGDWDMSGDGLPFPADPEMNLPEGTHPSIWEEITNGVASPLKYMVYYSYNMGYDPAYKKFYLQGVRLSIRAFRVEGRRWSSLWDTSEGAGIQYEFPAGFQSRITVRVSSASNGWYKARLASPEVNLTPFSATNNRLVVSGKPVAVPAFAFTRKLEALTDREKTFTQALKGVRFVEPGTPEIFDYLEYFRPLVDDTTQYTKQYWTINSTNWESNNPCLADKTRVVGIISTNAMGYEGSAPKFLDQTLKYRVAGFHYASDGKSLNKGTYDLIIRSDAARCLYGFSNAPISAVVSVTGASGTENVASTVISEKNGWLLLSAAGFTFSEKVITVKLQQEQQKQGTIATSGTQDSSTATTSASTSSSNSTSGSEKSSVSSKSKKSLKCVKGSKVKMVKSYKPTCPAGYRLATGKRP